MRPTHMSATDVLSLFDAPEPQDVRPADPDDRPDAGCVAYHPSKGVFIGIAPGAIFGVPGSNIAIWSGMDSLNQTEARLFPDAQGAEKYFALSGAATPDMIEALEYFSAPSGHWRDLQAMGLDVHDMPFNGMMHMQSEMLH